jgi:alpha-D-xyloside xylohydrolase
MKPVCILKQLLTICTVLLLAVNQSSAQQVEKIAPGIWKIVFGEQEKIKPGDFKEPASAALHTMPGGDTVPSLIRQLIFSRLTGSVTAIVPLSKNERIYGFGLQVNSFEQRGLRREIRTNARIIGNIGFSHAPLPFYISSNGYGIVVNSSRYINFYVGSQRHVAVTQDRKKETPQKAEPGSSPEALYGSSPLPSASVDIQVKGAAGIELLFFEGPSMKEVVARYNLYSGGGAIPPVWSLGFKYRAKNTFSANEVADFSTYFRNNHIPCDMLGLEPGWQSASYSCSYTWNKEKYPSPDSLLHVLHARHYKLNLWEHAYVHPSSPIHDTLLPFSGNYTVWNGAVPDFTLPAARNIFGDFHRKNFLDKGIAAFKLDECDGAYYEEGNAEWSFPDMASFPSGIDGEQMRQIFGSLYQKTILDEYKKQNRRTMLEARAASLFAAPYSAALYTDMYDHASFIRMMVNAGFSGLNWSPEVRQTKSDSDLIRRLQTSLLSAHMVVDCWFLKNLPWFQYDKDKNNNDIPLPNYKDLEAKAKRLIEMRMRLVPYLYGAFAHYHQTGIPPFRPLVMDYPQDEKTWKIDNQYMMGPDILCAPFIDGASTREVYLPAGVWYDFNSNRRYEGGKQYSISMSLDELPVFVKEGTILPLAKPVEYITPATVFELECRVYSKNPRPVILFEDDGYTFNYAQQQFNTVLLNWNKNKLSMVKQGSFKHSMYKLVSWKLIE